MAERRPHDFRPPSIPGYGGPPTPQMQGLLDGLLGTGWGQMGAPWGQSQDPQAEPDPYDALRQQWYQQQMRQFSRGSPMRWVQNQLGRDWLMRHHGEQVRQQAAGMAGGDLDAWAQQQRAGSGPQGLLDWIMQRAGVEMPEGMQW